MGVGPGFSKERSKLRPDGRKGASCTGKISGSFTRGEESLYKGRGMLVNMASLGTEYQQGVEGLCSSLDVGQSFPDVFYFLLISRTAMQGSGVGYGVFSYWKGTLAVRENGWKASTSGQERSCSMAAFIAMVASIVALLVCFGGQRS